MRTYIELSVTASDMLSFAKDFGYNGPPFCWNEKRRFLLRCELDAAFFHLYLLADANGGWHQVEGETAEDLARLRSRFPTPRDAVAYIMDTFPIVKRKDEEKWGEYRTKRVILEIYDTMADAIRTGIAYQTCLDPPAGRSACGAPQHHLQGLKSEDGAMLTSELLIGKGYFPHHIIPTLKSDAVTGVLFALPADFTTFPQKVSKPCVHSIPKRKHFRRLLAPPNPLHHIPLCRKLEEHWPYLEAQGTPRRGGVHGRPECGAGGKVFNTL